MIFTGILLSLLQFIHNRSLWLDESLLAINIINKSHVELLKPLDLGQVAPILFLEIEKVFSDLIPNSEFGLRLFPMISFWISLLAFYKIVKTIHHTSHTIIFSLSLFILNVTMLYYSAEVKQYMSDVLISTCVYLLTLQVDTKDTYTYISLCIVGILSIFLSHIAPIILCTVCIYLLADYYINTTYNRIHLITISSVWACTFALYYYIFIHNHPLRTYMIAYWGSHKCFMPINPLKKDFYQFLRDSIGIIAYDLFRFGKVGGIGLTILTLIGLIRLITQRAVGVIILAITPLIAHLLLSAFKLYPFDTRLILYTCPCIILMCSSGFNYLVSLFSVTVHHA